MPHLDRATPSSRGVPERALLALLDRLEDGLDPHALVVLRHGDVVLRTAWRPYDTDGPALVYSVSKTVTALGIGLLVGEGRLTLDDRLETHLDLPNPHGLTVRHLLAMATGHSREQTLALPFSVEALLTTPPEHAPGGHFAYSSPASFALSQIVTTLTGERLGDYVRPRLLDPLGIGERWWRPLGDLDEGFSGLHLTAEDLARLALLIAQDGCAGGHRLVPAEVVAAMTTPATPLPSESAGDGGEPGTTGDWAHGYGLHLWRSRHGFRLDGAYGQLGVAVPERGLVIGYLGATTDVQRTLDAFWALLAELADDALPPDDEAAALLAERVVAADSWGARDAVVAGIPGEAIDPVGWELRDADGGAGWELRFPLGHGSVVLPVPDGDWRHARVPHGERGLATATRGERRADGSALAHLVVTSSPHRLLVRRDPAGALDVRWHTTPLWRPDLTTLLVPDHVTDRAAR
ncbi:hypothetical protein C8046_12145 [Serinibacter arcticus]|uniref:Beta-lactamase-related domain-containing protein n=1 Tax=Serinibacter arcticus TaxID=1655435 RepID=A0A2U1ZWE1_9MICO|nr:serine hydrolase domain-containing protein [Serinibacter arcticus]PWD51299.1 hypothetical protein C8046_12145 [Serinibacter arcticus]